MNAQAIASTKQRLQRKLAITTVLCLFWAGSLLAISGRGIAGLDSGTYLYMGVAVLSAWAAIAEHDERNVLITYKATRLAVVIIMCAAPVAICVLAFFDMRQSIDTVAVALCFFVLAYLASWLFTSRRS